MQSEIENIIKGQVVSTPDFDLSKKVIGISTSNLVPDATGYSPLGSQRAFIQPQTQVQTPQTPQAAASQVVAPSAPSAPTPVAADSLSSAQPVIENPLASTPQSPASDGVSMDWNDFFNKSPDDTVPATELPAVDSLPNTAQQGVILDNPIEVGDMGSLNNLSGSGLQPSDLIKPVVDSATPAVEAAPVAVEMPAMPTEVVPGEPVTTNDSLFSEPIADLNPSSPTMNPTVEQSSSPSEVVSETKNDLSNNNTMNYEALVNAIDKLVAACVEIKNALTQNMNKEATSQVGMTTNNIPLPDQSMETLDTLLTR